MAMASLGTVDLSSSETAKNTFITDRQNAHIEFMNRQNERLERFSA